MASRPAAPSLVKLKHRCRRALFCRQHREVIVAASCILKVDRDIRTNDVSAFAQAISERRQRDLDTHTLFKSRRPDREPADHRYRRLLRSRGAGCRAVRDGAVPVRGARRRVALDLGGGAGAAGSADRRVVGGVVGAAARERSPHPNSGCSNALSAVGRSTQIRTLLAPSEILRWSTLPGEEMSQVRGRRSTQPIALRWRGPSRE